MLTQDDVKTVLSYDSETGIFRWLIPNRKIKVGDVAGHKQSKGYLAIWLHGQKYLLHRIAFIYMTGGFPKNQVDHINRNKLDNSWANLRDVSGSANLMNTPETWAHSSSGQKGVTWYPRYQAWQAQIKVKGIMKYIGRFTSYPEAVAARKRAEIRYHGN